MRSNILAEEVAARRGVFCIEKQMKNSADTNKNTNK